MNQFTIKIYMQVIVVSDNREMPEAVYGNQEIIYVSYNR